MSIDKDSGMYSLTCDICGEIADEEFLSLEKQ